MKKLQDVIKAKLKEQWEHACESYLRELLRMWGLDSFYGYWIGEEVGGVYDYGGMMTIGMEDIIYCVENDVEELQYQEWQDYIRDAAEFGFDTPNLKSWMKGCPRTDEATFKCLREIKAKLNEAIREERERVRHEEVNNPF